MDKYKFNVLGSENVLGHNIVVIDLIDKDRTERVVLLKDFCNICAATRNFVNNIIKESNDIVLGKHIFNIMESNESLNKLLSLNLISKHMINGHRTGKMLVITRHGCEMIFKKLNLKTKRAIDFMQEKNLNNYFGEYK